MYQGSDHPQAGYRCEGGGPEKGGSWRFGARANTSLFQQAVDADGNFTINLVEIIVHSAQSVFFAFLILGVVLGLA
jgi:hypothetical protein